MEHYKALISSLQWLSDSGLGEGGAGGVSGSVVAGLVVTDAVLVAVVGLVAWCAWDTAGRDWVKLKRFTESSQRASDR